jgi:UBX domain-containing protein 1
LEAAVTEYFTAQEEGVGAHGGAEADEDQEMEEEPPYTGPRTLDGRPAPSAIPTSGSSNPAPPKKRGGIATLGSIAPTDPHAGHGHAHDDDDDSDDEDFEPDEEPRDLFAGGEKSGLAVQDPSQKRLVKDILKKARA